MKREDALTGLAVSFFPADFFHSASFSYLGVIKLGSIQSVEMATGTCHVRCSRTIISLYKPNTNGWFSFHDPGVPHLSTSGLYFLWCPMTNTGIKWCRTRQSLCDGALHYGGVTYSPQLVCVLGVSSRLQLRPDTREGSSEGKISLLLTWDTMQRNLPLIRVYSDKWKWLAPV